MYHATPYAPQHPPYPPKPTEQPTTGAEGWKGDIHSRKTDGWVTLTNQKSCTRPLLPLLQPPSHAPLTRHTGFTPARKLPRAPPAPRPVEQSAGGFQGKKFWEGAPHAYCAFVCVGFFLCFACVSCDGMILPPCCFLEETTSVYLR
jgi:hypothetical protein